MYKNNEINVRPDKDRLINLLNDVKKGKIVVPKFQRDIVWNVKQRLDLFDSISKGFPIGSLLFWNPEKDDFGFNKKIGPYTLDLNTKKYSYIIDGYQRITTLFSALNNPLEYVKNKVDQTILDEYIVYYSLEDEEFFHLIKTRNKNNISVSNIPLYVLVDTFEFLTFTKKIQEEFDETISNLYINRAKKLATALLDYEVAFVNIHGGSIQDAVEIFSRINSKGSDMSPMWMLSALTYKDGKNGFKFSDEIEDLKIDLEEFNFEDIKTEILLQCIRSSTGKLYIDTKTETLAKSKNFKNLALKTFENIYQAVDFLYHRTNVLNINILPYNLQLIFITEFFRLVDNPSEEKLNELERWFWQTTYASYFSIYSLSKQRKAFAKFQRFCRGEELEAIYKANDNEVFEAVEFPSKMNYGSVRSKALGLFMIKTLIEKTEIDDYDFDDFLSLSKHDKDFVLLFPKFESQTYETEFRALTRSKKIKDYSFILNGKTLNFDYQANFINNSILDCKNDIDKIKRLRYSLIAASESKFVESLDINYNGTDRYDENNDGQVILF
ncbi:uncharacterized protein DUF262 [Winogradskyella eximia]|uniref:Uncharacterized protein DUF262 n=1 Tax=Winogradskyella eximia TaxID=262006 RepID=A0A3D9H6V7_9FLAO|nr:DUF262 domain-containing protein [Winogradskyella eximia]RED45245.1 uncharacterized protein DUF262 [Winogradskyella eximia]